jgi:2-dehydropantoate 2-reductase
VRILVLGAGGIGGFFGGHLVKAGADAAFLVRDRRAAQLRRSGLVIDSPLGCFAIPVKVTTHADQVERPDIVVLACKAYDLADAMDTIGPALAPGTVILPLLNGLAHLDQLSSRFPANPVWGGLAHLGVTMADDGTIRHLNNLSIIQFGSRSGAIDARAAQFAALFAGTPVQASARPRIEQDMWDKLVFLATLAGITCLMRANVGAIVATPAGARVILQLLEECCAVADASGFRPSDGQLATYRSQLTQRGSTSKASMLRDIERGGRTEGEHILGDMLARAQHHRIDAPLLEIALTHLRAYEAARFDTSQ